MRVLVNGEERELDNGLTVAGLVELLAPEAEGRGLAVAVDGDVVPRTAWERTALGDGARVEVVVAVQGG